MASKIDYSGNQTSNSVINPLVPKGLSTNMVTLKKPKKENQIC
jgi:hypothetical protein